MTEESDTSDGAPQQPGIPTERFEKVEVATVDDLRDWLQVNHGREEGVWLVTGKKSAGERFIDRWDVLDQLLCFGWVDGIRRKLDETRTMQLITPRRQQTWALTYKKRVKKLEEAGLMTDAGRSAIKRSKKLGLWNATAKVDALVVPDDLRVALAAIPAAEQWFDQAAPSYRRNLLRWLANAKTPPTRLSRIEKIVTSSASATKIRNM